jgi:hypothetical protein
VTEAREGGDDAPGSGDECDPAGGAELFDEEVGGKSGGDGCVSERVMILACRGIRRADDVHASGNRNGREECAGV